MRHSDDTARGSWIRERLGDPLTIAVVAPTGFEAYARVFHPVDVQWLEWHGDSVRSASEESLTWAEAAGRLGAVAHPLMQWNAMAPGRDGSTRDEDGWQWGEPRVGGLPPETLATVSGVLARHTGRPDRCTAALWEGHGWIHGGVSVIAFATDETDPDARARMRREAVRREAPRFPPHVMAAPRLELPGRAYLLFDADILEFTEPQWPVAIGWEDSPNLLWPEDRAWFLASEIDFDTTIIGGSRSLIDELVATSGLEASEIPPTASLQWDADTINAPPG